MTTFLTPAILASCLDEKIGPTWQTLSRQVATPSLLPAAVIVPLVPRDREWDLLFIRRTQTVSHHKGQIAFPGGRAESADTTPLATALREFQEELGLDPLQMHILGRLPPTPTLQTGYLIHPFVGLLPAPPIPRPDPAEVAGTLLIPLNVFLERVKLNPDTPHFDHQGEVVWGATARIMTQFSVAILTRSTCAS
ncbi:MAG: CoA pyrophosphatase [Magnetococcales bacterium]|nr:CoA pyrophosphatase [Magnetococcales bacterium]